MRDYLIVNNEPVEFIRINYSKPRVRVTIDESKWDVSIHFADSGSVIDVLIRPKEG